MIPSIFPGDLIDISPVEKDLENGQIYLYQSADKLIIHRLSCSDTWPGTNFITKGDNNIVPDPPISREQILGRVSRVRKSIRHCFLKVWHSIKQRPDA